MNHKTEVKKVSHTPGPWIYQQNKKEGMISIKISNDTDDILFDDSICGIWALSAEAKANAKLIAAAPEMLRCLKNVLHTKPHKESIVAMKKLIISVISKAE